MTDSGLSDTFKSNDQKERAGRHNSICKDTLRRTMDPGRFCQETVLTNNPVKVDKFFEQVERSEKFFIDKYRGKRLSELVDLTSFSGDIEIAWEEIELINSTGRVYTDQIIVSQPNEWVHASTSNISQLGYTVLENMHAEKRHEGYCLALKIVGKPIGIVSQYAIAQDTNGNFVILALYAHNPGRLELNEWEHAENAVVIVKEPVVTGFGLINSDGSNALDFPAIVRVDNYTDVVILDHKGGDDRIPLVWGTKKGDLDGMELRDLIERIMNARQVNDHYEALRIAEFACSQTENLMDSISTDDSLVRVLRADCCLTLNRIENAVKDHDYVLRKCSKRGNLLSIKNLPEDNPIHIIWHRVRFMIALHRQDDPVARAEADFLFTKFPRDKEYANWKQWVCLLEVDFRASKEERLDAGVEFKKLRELILEGVYLPYKPILQASRPVNANERFENDCTITIVRAIPGQVLYSENASCFSVSELSRVFFEVCPARRVIFPGHRILTRNQFTQHAINNPYEVQRLTSILSVVHETLRNSDERFADLGYSFQLSDGRYTLHSYLIDLLYDYGKFGLESSAKLREPRGFPQYIKGFTYDGYQNMGSLMLPYMRHFEYSCTPNAVLSTLGNIVVVRAIKPLEVGTRITLSLFDCEMEYEDRSIQSKRQFGGMCKCQQCKRERKDFKKAYEEGDFFKSECHRLSVLTDYSNDKQCRVDTSEFKPGRLLAFLEIIREQYPRNPSAVVRYSCSHITEHAWSEITLRSEDVDLSTADPNVNKNGPFLCTGPGPFMSVLNMKLHLVADLFMNYIKDRGFVLDSLGIKKWGQMSPALYRITKQYKGIELRSSPKVFTKDAILAWRQIALVAETIYGWNYKVDILPGTFVLQDYLEEINEERRLQDRFSLFVSCPDGESVSMSTPETFNPILRGKRRQVLIAAERAAEKAAEEAEAIAKQNGTFDFWPKHWDKLFGFREDIVISGAES